MGHRTALGMKHAGHGSVGKLGRLLGVLVGVGIGVPGGLWAERVEALNIGIYVRRENPSEVTIKQALEQLFYSS